MRGNALETVPSLGSAKTDPVQFKWGFGEVLLKDKFAFKSLIKVLYLRGENCLRNTHFYKQKGPCLKAPLNWTGSVFPLLNLAFVCIFKSALHSNVPSNLVPMKHCRGKRGGPWHGPSAYPGRHFSIRTLRYKRAFGAGTRYASWDLFLGILGASGRDQGGTWYGTFAKPERHFTKVTRPQLGPFFCTRIRNGH